MADSEELRRLREELTELHVRAERLAERLDALEAEARAAKEIGPFIPPPPRVEPDREELPPVPTAPDSSERPATALISEVTPPGRGPGPLTMVMQAVARAEARVREEGWEILLGTYWLPRIGILVVTTAVVLLLSLAIQRWGPPVRVAIGYGVCAALLGLGWRLEKTYATFSRVLYSGGIALSYFVTYATHYIPYARVTDNPAITLTLLAAVVVVWALVAEARQSRIVAMLVTFLGHYTIYLSGPGRYSVVGIFVLSAGSAFFLLRHRWYYVALVGIAGSYVNHFLWMGVSMRADRPIDFWIGIGFLSGYLLIFALAELLSPEELRRKRVPTWFRTGFVTLNTAGFLILGTLLVQEFEFARPHQDVFRVATAAVLILIALGYLLRRDADPLYNVYFVKGVAVFTLGLAARYSGNSLSAWLAIETVVLLVSARRSGLLVTRLLAFAVGCIAFAHGASTILTMGTVTYGDPSFRMQVVQACLTVLAFLVASQLYQRTDWSTRMPPSAPCSAHTLFLLWRLDLVAECPPQLERLGKPFGGLLFPYLYALGGATLFLRYTTSLVADRHDVLVIALTAFALTGAAGLLSAKPYGLASLVLMAVAVIQWITDYFTGVDLFVPFTLASLIALACVAVSSERPLLGRREGLAFHQARAVPYFVYGSVVLIWGLFVIRELSFLSGVGTLALCAIVAAGLFPVLHARAMAWASTALLLWAQMYWGWDASPLLEDTAKSHALAWVLIFLPLCLDRYCLCDWAKRRAGVPGLSIVLVGSSWLFTLKYIHEATRAFSDWAPFWWAVTSFAFLAYGLGFRSKPGMGVAVLGGLIATVKIIGRSYDVAMPMAPLVGGYGLLAGFWILCERLYTWASTRFNVEDKLSPVALFVAFAAALLAILLERIPGLSDYYLTVGWTLLAGALFALALTFHQKHYRYAGLVVFVLALGRAFLIDMRELEALYRVAAFAVLGTVLLAVSYGYVAARKRFLAQGKPIAERPQAPTASADDSPS